jgi:nucleoside-diphosphate-sugar epimerase
MRIVIPNVTEYLSSRVSLALVAHGFEVVGVGDDRTIGDSLITKGVQFCFADSTKYSTVISSVLRPEDILINASAPYQHWRKTYKQGKKDAQKIEQMMQAAIENKISKYIFLSSAALYAGFSDVLSIEEDYQPKNQVLSPYLSTIVSAEQKAFDTSDVVPAVVLRPAEIYSNDEKPGESFFKQLLHSSNIPLIGARGALMEFTSCENVVRALIAAIRCERDNKFDVFHISDGNPNYADLLLKDIAEIDSDDISNISRARARLLVATLAVRSSSCPIPSDKSPRRSKKRPQLNSYLLATLGYHLTLDLSRARRIFGFKPSGIHGELHSEISKVSLDRSGSKTFAKPTITLDKPLSVDEEKHLN